MLGSFLSRELKPSLQRKSDIEILFFIGRVSNQEYGTTTQVSLKP
jgi:hypothetical protein